MDGIDLVMLGLTMPVINGNDAYVALRALNQKEKKVLCSGYTATEVKGECSQLKQFAFDSESYLMSAVKAAASKFLA